jgi:methionine synthase II (cobalamin-independent)
VLAPQIEAWAEAGCALVVLSEPFLARTGDSREAVAALAELPTSIPLALQLVFGDASRVLDDLADAPVAAVGVDFYSTALEAVPDDYPREVLAGVVDARSSALEDVGEIGRFVDRLAERNPAGIALGPNGDLQFVPESIAREKLACLGRARAAHEEVREVRA